MSGSSGTLEAMRAFADRLRRQLDDGLDLREISRASYAAREAGEDVPYMQIVDASSGRGGAVTRLEAAPTSGSATRGRSTSWAGRSSA